ncbi:FadR/GntR family transcriptional regulator [Zavarzinia sp. CC-PAN008]|uniref:FadR/GntR family transcriptional regulator n=1 Tax=Zavarzinia sp. CC-PAN008 TaxID=3243332 RepID=UPI003F74378A
MGRIGSALAGARRAAPDAATRGAPGTASPLAEGDATARAALLGNPARTEGLPAGLPSQGPRGAAAIAAQLRRAITDGLYGYGDRLPPEREIAKTLNTSRTTVRSALKQLEDARLVARKVGSGTFVVHGTRQDERDIAEITSPLELIEVRLALEPRMVRLAIIHGTARDFDHLGEALAQVEQSNGDTEHFTRWDLAFHLALATATRNPLMVWVYRQVNHVRNHTQWSAMKDKVLTRERMDAYNQEHRALYEAVRARDVTRATDLILRHLDEARIDLLGADST